MTRRQPPPPAHPPELVSHLEHSFARFLGGVKMLLSESRRQGNDARSRALILTIIDALNAFEAKDYENIPGLVLFGPMRTDIRVTRRDVTQLLRWARWTRTHYIKANPSSRHALGGIR